MKLEHIQDNIDNLIELENNRRLAKKEIGRVSQILMSHQIKNRDFNSLYLISSNLCAKDLRKIAIILLRHKIYLRCGICGDYIKSTHVYSVDHIYPLSDGGLDITDNIQHSHIDCNSAKADSVGFVSFYNNPEVIDLYVASDEYKHLIEIRGNSYTVTDNITEKPIKRYRVESYQSDYSR
jgi:hypothetical protein